MEVVINKCYGGFGISKALAKELKIKSTYIDNDTFKIKSDNYNAYRTNKKLIAAIKKVGLAKANGEFSDLSIVEIPDDIDFYIDDYDGMESIHEKHKSWS